MGNSKFAVTALRAASVRELLSIFDGHLPKSTSTSFGVESDSTSINKARRQANEAALALLAQNPDPNLLTEEQKNTLRAYSGRGGIGDSTNEYYTPPELAAGVWSLMKAYGFENGNVLEPSCATGVFNGTKPGNVIMTGAEVDPTSSQINQLLHPEDTINTMPFEALAKATPDDHFDAVVGNAPFGKRMNTYAAQDDTYRDLKTNEQYFVTRSIDKVKPGGLVTLIVNTAIVSTKSLSKFRAAISRKAEFLGAHRIPSGTFGASGSDSVVTDVVIFRKHPKELAEKMVDMTDAQLQEANVLWDTFISGRWFEADGRKFIHGEVLTGAGQWGSDLVVIPGLPKAEQGKQLNAAQRIEKANTINAHNAAMAKKLSKRFESRIDWDLLESTEPVIANYIDGDRRMINGRWFEMTDGAWLPIALTDAKGSLDEALYGYSSVTAIKDAMTDTRSALQLPFHQLENIYSNMRDTLPFEVVSAFRLADQAPAEHRERLVRGALIGARIQAFNERKIAVDGYDSDLLELREYCASMYRKLGDSNKVRGIKKLSGESAAAYNIFKSALDKDGNFRDLLSGNVERRAAQQFSSDNPTHVLEQLTASIVKTITLDEFRASYTGPGSDLNDNDLLNKLSLAENIAIDQHGNIALMDRAIAGDAVINTARLLSALGNENLSDAVKFNISRQLDMITARRKWTDASRINFGLRDQFIPRQTVLEFLQQEGFTLLKFVGMESTIDPETDDEVLKEVEVTDGQTGFFTGYYTQDGQQKTRKDDDGGTFGAQLEKYLNGLNVRSSDAKENSKYRDRIRGLEKRFQIWLRQHDSIDTVVKAYNDTFNAHVDFDHSDAPIAFEGVSGEVEHKPYQNSAIRRMSEDGRGILGFGTGLGKTFTALGLAQFNLQTGRNRRVCIVMPKAVTENWINETVMFYGGGNLSKVMFVGHSIEYKDGQMQTRPVLDSKGEAKTNPVTGNAMSTPILRELSAQEITNNMHLIPHSDVNLVLMTKEQFARIPLRQDTLDENARDHLFAHQDKGHVAMMAKGYKEQAKRESVLNRFSDEGTEKVFEYPFFEDMNFDLVIADEGHNYRNSQDAGQLGRNLVYVSAGQEAQVAADMRQKLHYLKRKHNGRGAILLTATPTPNSPLDIYNMLSHVMTTDEWMKLGIANQDDFIKHFGEVSEVMISRISGGIAHVEGLTGFKNLDALRSMFHRWINKKSVDDVKEDVKVPTIEDKTAPVEMSKEQKAAYELLRFRAKLLSDKAKGIDSTVNATPKELELIERLESMYPDDQLFSIIRDMDRVCSDIELFNGRMTFVFSKDKAPAARKLVTGLVTEKTITVNDINDAGEKVKVKKTIHANVTVKEDQNGHFTIQINEAFESELLAGLKKAGLSQKDVTHPLSPKYAQLVENLKEAMKDGGKQLIFSEEKSQHKKLHRILCHHLQLEPEQIGILNGDTVSGKDSVTNDENEKAKKAKPEAGQDDEAVEQEGLEGIASKYNSGKFKILILNKKGEVGVNLHIGTSDIHHLTLPWTRDALTQRNGRGARVGAPQDKVISHTYVCKESFDVFRKDTIDRKGSWQDELFMGDAVRVANGDAEPDFDVNAMMATNLDEYRALVAEQKRKAADALKQEKRTEATIALHNMIRATKLMQRDLGKEEAIESDLAGKMATQQAKTSELETKLLQAREKWESANNAGQDQTAINYLRSKYKDAVKAHEAEVKKLREAQQLLGRQRAVISSIERAKTQARLMRTNVETAIDEGVLNISKDDLDHASEMAAAEGRIYRTGEYYEFIKQGSSYGPSVVRIDEFTPDQSQARTEVVLSEDMTVGTTKLIPLKLLTRKTHYSESELQLRQQLRTATFASVGKLVSRDDFYRYIQEGAINRMMRVFYVKDGQITYDHLTMAAKKLGESNQLHDIIYPDPTSSKTRELVINDGLLKLRNSSYTGVTELWQTILGDDYMTIISNADPERETDEQIATWLTTAEESYKRIGGAAWTYDRIMDAAKAEEVPVKKSYLQSILLRGLRNVVPSRTTQTDRYWTAINGYIKELENRFDVDFSAHMEAVKDYNSKLTTAALGDDTEIIRTRLKSLTPSLFRLRPFYDKAGADAVISSSTYETVNQLAADLITAGYEPRGEYSGSYALSNADMLELASSVWSEARTNREKLTAYLADGISQAPESTPTTSAPAELMGDISFAKAMMDKHGIQCKRSTKPIRGKGAYEWIGLFDPKGYGHALQKTLAGKNNPNKEKLSAVWYSKAGDELENHWLIPADIDPNVVIAVFGL